MERRVHPVRLPFLLPIDAQHSVPRFVHAYIVAGDRVCIVDSGAAGSQQGLIDALAALGRTPADVAWVVNTHEHPDHIGGNSFLRSICPAEFACHAAAVRWIEDLDLQHRERPILGFHSLAGQPIRVGRRLADGDEIDLGGASLQVIFSPGHSPGSIALFCPQDGSLLVADTLQPVGGLPLYWNLAQLRASLARLAALPGVRTLYGSHNEKPFVGPEVSGAFRASLGYLERVDALVRQVTRDLPGSPTAEEITRETLQRLGLSAPPVMPITVASIMAHLG